MKNEYKCNDEVKKHFKQSHCKYNTSRKGKVLKGAFLNKFIAICPFISNKSYNVCYTLARSIEKGNIVPLTEDERQCINDETIGTLKRVGALPAVSPVVATTIRGNEDEENDRHMRYRRRLLIREHEEENEKESEIHDAAAIPVTPAHPPIEQPTSSTKHFLPLIL